ncbi:hypothetical protein ACRAWF_09550 [Streptomyces sp. L7]
MGVSRSSRPRGGRCAPGGRQGRIAARALVDAGGGAEAGETRRETILRELRRKRHCRGRDRGSRGHRIREGQDSAARVRHGLGRSRQRQPVLGEGQELRLFPLGALPEPMPPHVRHYVDQLAQRLLSPQPVIPPSPLAAEYGNPSTKSEHNTVKPGPPSSGRDPASPVSDGGWRPGAVPA